MPDNFDEELRKSTHIDKSKSVISSCLTCHGGFSVDRPGTKSLKIDAKSSVSFVYGARGNEYVKHHNPTIRGKLQQTGYIYIYILRRADQYPGQPVQVPPLGPRK